MKRHASAPGIFRTGSTPCLSDRMGSREVPESDDKENGQIAQQCDVASVNRQFKVEWLMSITLAQGAFEKIFIFFSIGYLH